MKHSSGDITQRWQWLTVTIVMAGFMTGSLLAAQRNQGRVFTNEDIGTTPPPPAAAPASDAPAAPSAAPAAARPAAGMSTPVADLNRAVALQGTLMDLYGEFNGKAQEAVDAAPKKRWTDMSVWVGNLMQANQQNIRELQEQVPAEQWPRGLTAPFGAETPAPPAP